VRLFVQVFDDLSDEASGELVSVAAHTTGPGNERAVEEDTMGTVSLASGSTPLRVTGVQLRLTVRGRLLLIAAALLVTLSAMMLAIAPSVIATDGRGESAPVTEVTVQPGDTLWDIASAANPGGELTATVEEIAELNGLEDGQLQAGQELLVPRY
jgi:LysM repeat protein